MFHLITAFRVLSVFYFKLLNCVFELYRCFRDFIIIFGKLEMTYVEDKNSILSNQTGKKIGVRFDV